MSAIVNETEQLEQAARDYVTGRLVEYPYPEDRRQFRDLLEIAFLRGAHWHLQLANKKLDEALKGRE